LDFALSLSGLAEDQAQEFAEPALQMHVSDQPAAEMGAAVLRA
jgi:hypothetical protein